MLNNKIPTVYIIVLNYNGSDDTITCLNSLLKISYNNYKIVIVDNASTDKSIDAINLYMKDTESIDMIKLIVSKKNGGYGYGNNLGIKYALSKNADYILVLNNDTIVSTSFLEPLVATCVSDSSIGICGGQIFYADKPDVFWFNGGTYNACTGRIIHKDIGKINQGQLPEKNTTFISGCMWLIPKRIFHDVGMINEEYFMYIEDLEFTQRVLEKGYRLKVVENSKIYHSVGGSSGGEMSAFTIYWMTKNCLLFMKKHMKWQCWPLGFLNGVLRHTVHALLNRRIDLVSTQVKAIYHAIGDK